MKFSDMNFQKLLNFRKKKLLSCKSEVFLLHNTISATWCVCLQVICDSDLRITNRIAKWPGPVHDARILRESALFSDFECSAKPLSGYMNE